MLRECLVIDNLLGYYDENGKFIVCEELDVSDEQSDRYSVEVQNGDGYYSSSGRFVRYRDFD